MHISRATGTPLLDLTSTSKRQDEQAPGLVGALAARQREKAAMTQGIRSSMVQQAILARQQQQFQLEAEVQAQMQYEYQQRAQQEAQSQYEAQQRAQQDYHQKMANRNSMISLPQMSTNYPQSMAPTQQAAFGHGRPQSMHLPVQQNLGGYGGQYVQQQGMVMQQQAQNYSGYNNMQPGGQGRQSRR